MAHVGAKAACASELFYAAKRSVSDGENDVQIGCYSQRGSNVIKARHSWSVWALVIGLVLDALNEYFGAWLPGWVTWCVFSAALACRFISQEAVREQAVRLYCRVTKGR